MHPRSLRTQPRIGIINTSEEMTQLLHEFMSDEGFATAAVYVPEFKRSAHDIAAFFHSHRPQAILYDIDAPYLENWAFFKEQVLARDLLPVSRFVLTTTNRIALERLVGPTNAIELIEPLVAPDAIMQTVYRTLDSRSVG
jgi:hypothetical protein